MSLLPVTLNTRLKPVEHDPFKNSALAAFYPLTEAQREVWLSAVMETDGNLAYNEGINLTLKGALKVDALRSALQTILDRHEALRGRISPDGRSMCILAALELPWRFEDLSASADPAAELMRREEQEMRLPFDLENGPLLRFCLLKTGPEQHHLLFVAHHIVCDGWSGAVVLTELGALYSAAVEGKSIELYVPQRYGDYAVLEDNFLRSEEGRKHEAYWLKLLENPPAPLDLPTDRPYPPTRSFRAARVDRRLDAALVAELRKTGAAHNASLVATVLAGFGALLHRLSGSEDLVIGLAAAGQSLHSQPKLVGHCVNMLPLRLKPAAGQAFTELLKQAKTAVMDAHEHQGVTFGRLLPKIKLDRDGSRAPLMSVIFNIDVRDDDITHTGLEVSYATMVRRGENFELYFNIVDNGRDLVLECSYNADLFDAASIEQRLTEFDTLLRGICKTPTASLPALPMLDAGTQQKILQDWNRTARDYSLHLPLHRFIERQAGLTPQAPAVITDSGRLSYAELETRANQLAHWLIAQGVKPDSIVAVCAQRSIEMVIALLATLKAGGAYLPLDPAYPAERLAFMLEDAKCPVILAQVDGYTEMSEESRKAVFGGSTPVLHLKTHWAGVATHSELAPQVDVKPEHLAYVIYTSGSTGKPKGALLEHRGIVNRLLWMQEEYQLGASDKVLQKTPYSFDVSVWEFFWPLMTGAALVMAKPEGHKDPRYLAELIQREGISTTHFVPSMLAAFLEDEGAARCTALKKVFCSGEALPYDLTQRFFGKLPDCELHNLYGPTEASVDVSYWPCRKSDERRLVPIGFPVANTQLYVLDRGGGLAPPGVPGELHLGGIQLARGYLNRPDLTAEKFITHPQLGRLYRTGDSCRWLADGSVEYYGRLDFQVKLRGFRIELGEIEAELNRHPSVLESVAAIRERSPGDPRLVAYLTPRAGSSATQSELRAHLRKTLPEHMIPQHFAELAELPHLSNGKINRKALPDPFAQSQSGAAAKTAPRTDTERAVAAIWTELLKLPSVGIEDRFFDLGGHSLLAVQAAARLQKAFGARLPLRSVMMDPLGVLASQLGSAAPAAPSPAAPATVPASAPLPDAPTPGGWWQRLRKSLNL